MVQSEDSWHCFKGVIILVLSQCTFAGPFGPANSMRVQREIIKRNRPQSTLIHAHRKKGGRSSRELLFEFLWKIIYVFRLEMQVIFARFSFSSADCTGILIEFSLDRIITWSLICGKYVWSSFFAGSSLSLEVRAPIGENWPHENRLQEEHSKIGRVDYTKLHWLTHLLHLQWIKYIWLANFGTVLRIFITSTVFVV